MDPNRKLWNQQQQTLRRALLGSDDHEKTVELFMSQHAMVHSARVARSKLWSFEDRVWQDTTEEVIRCIPRGCEHSIAWCIWHITRIEDVTMNLLVAGSPQILHRDNWLERMKARARDTGNAMDAKGVAGLSATIDIEVLRAYRLKVGRRTRQIVKQLQPEELKQRVEPSRLQQVMVEGAVVEAASGLIDYWGGLNVAGLLLMPPTRHSFVHLNEALRVKLKANATISGR
jgi:hypothetical protein